jgi:hypothetical protein
LASPVLIPKPCTLWQTSATWKVMKPAKYTPPSHVQKCDIYTNLLQFQRENDDSGALFTVLHSAEIQLFWGSYTLLLVIVALRFQWGRYNLFQGLTD